MGLDQPIWLVKMLQFTVIFLVSINQPGGKKVIYDYQSSFLLVIQVTVTCWNLVKFHFMLVNSLLLGTSPFSSAKSSSLPNSHVLWPNSAFSLAKNHHPKKKRPLAVSNSLSKGLWRFQNSTSILRLSVQLAQELQIGIRAQHGIPMPSLRGGSNATTAHLYGRHPIGCLLGWFIWLWVKTLVP